MFPVPVRAVLNQLPGYLGTETQISANTDRGHGVEPYTFCSLRRAWEMRFYSWSISDLDASLLPAQSGNGSWSMGHGGKNGNEMV